MAVELIRQLEDEANFDLSNSNIELSLALAPDSD